MYINRCRKCRKIMTYPVSFLLGVLIIYVCSRFIGENTEAETIKNSLKNLRSREEIIEQTRSRIRRELKHYNFNYSGVHDLEDLVTESGGNPMRSIVVSTWRSGSTFLGELLNVMPGNFYNYEPFVHHKVLQVRGPPHAEKDLRMLKSLLKCDYKNKDVKIYFKHKKTDSYHFRHDSQLMEFCQFDQSLCFDASFTESFCKLFPFLTVKLVRLRLRVLQDIMEEDGLNLRMVLLIRDPRAVMESRSHLPGCNKWSPDCSDPKSLCSDMVSDYEIAKKLLRLYPTRFTVLRYEPLALNPRQTTHKLYSFLQLLVPPSLDDYINTHTNSDMPCGMFCTYRTSSDRAFKWKYLMDFERVHEIQSSCKEAMSLWGYRNADNATHLKSEEFYPVDNIEDIKIL